MMKKMRIVLVRFFSVQNIKIKIKIQIHQIHQIHKVKNQIVVVLVAYYNLFNQYKIYEFHIFTHKNKTQNCDKFKSRQYHPYQKTHYQMKYHISGFASIQQHYHYSHLHRYQSHLPQQNPHSNWLDDYLIFYLQKRSS